jgi:SEC-C motif-containing protein
MNKNQPCPCGSGMSYGVCCQPWWASRRRPQTAEQLMRSRYSAFVLEKAQYLYDSHHPDHRAADELKALKQSFRGMVWLGLEIVATEAGQATDTSGMVEFRAHFRQLGATGVIHERSRFIYEYDQWWYQKGEVLSAS